jgi:hypothetical protein
MLSSGAVSTMSFQGKQIPTDIEELIIQLKRHHDKERKEGEFISTKDPSGRTAKALGVGVSTVKRIMSRYVCNGEKILPKVIQRPGRPPSDVYQEEFDSRSAFEEEGLEHYLDEI